MALGFGEAPADGPVGAWPEPRPLSLDLFPQHVRQDVLNALGQALDIGKRPTAAAVGFFQGAAKQETVLLLARLLRPNVQKVNVVPVHFECPTRLRV